jgi:poly(hydroxyalkanoate) depolymerase family esterase
MRVATSLSLLSPLAVCLVAACGGSSASSPSSTIEGSDGGITADGAVILPDGAVVLPDGGVVAPDGGTIVPTSDAGDAASGSDAITGHLGSSLPLTLEGRNVLLYVPSARTPGKPLPLVVMLHGCTQTPADFETGTGMDAVAEQNGFFVAYVEEPTSANPEQCWNWFLPADQSRGSGEPMLLANIVKDLSTSYEVDPTRVFAAGLSAGAAMAVVLGATYPDVFAAIGVCSGLEYAAGTDETSALTASASGGPDPTKQGDLAFSAMGASARPVPVMVWHGDQDQVVNVTNATQIIQQWSETDTRAGATVGPAMQTTGSTSGASWTHSTYAGGTGATSLLELYIVHGMGHAWAGGNASGSYTDPNAPDASLILWQFFASHPK